MYKYPLRETGAKHLGYETSNCFIVKNLGNRVPQKVSMGVYFFA